MRNIADRVLKSGYKGHHMNRVAFTLVTFLSLYAQAASASPEEVPRPPREGEEVGSSIAPVVGYDPTFGVVLGGAYFYKQPSLSAHVDANTNFGKVYQLHYSYKHYFADFWEHGLRGGIMKGFDPYYGEGNTTNRDHYFRLWGFQSDHRFYAGIKTSENAQVGVFVDARTRTEDGGHTGSPPANVAPDEQTGALGAYVRIDTRNLKNGNNEGFALGATVKHSPGALTSVVGTQGFTQVEGDFIVYKEILNGVIPDVIAAFNVKGGVTLGTPTYMFKYRLGGANTLRGYLENRFRGSKYYLQQTELRFPIFTPVSGVGFIGFGDVTDGEFGDAKVSRGFGLRIGIPPDYVSAIRLDVGFAKDQWGFFANFGQVF